MFDSLDEKIKHDVEAESSRSERIVKGVVIMALAVVLFGGLYFAIRTIG
jgi:hypothetical protein